MPVREAEAWLGDREARFGHFYGVKLNGFQAISMEA